MGQKHIHCYFIELEFGAGARAKERGASAEERGASAKERGASLQR